MKTLYLGYYDYSFFAKAYVIKNGIFIEYEMSKEELDYFNKLLYRDNTEEYKEKLQKYFKKFDSIIACDDGTYYLIK